MELTFGALTETAIGPISFFAGENGLKRLAFSTLRSLKQEENLGEQSPSLHGLELIGVLLGELNEYLYGIRKEFSIQIDWDFMGEFQQQVLAYTREIPYGQVKTYGEIARALGKPGASRAVGMALGSNPIPIIIPCHRVIGVNGELRGYLNGIPTKAFLLGLEGQTIRDGKINLQAHQ